MVRTSIHRALALAGIVGVAACAVGPDYRPSTPSAPAAWDAPVVNGLTDKASAPATWWASFNDGELNSLIERAAKSNLDLRVAEARLRQARAVRGGSAADFWPALSADASADRAKQSEHQPLIGSLPLPPNFPFEYSVYQAGFDASWELDLFGGKRRALEAATADMQGAIEARNDALLSLLAEVARNYVELRGTQQRLAIANRNLKLEQEDLELARARLQGGVATELDVTRSAALLGAVRATIPPLETEQRAAMYALAVLLAEQPGGLVAELSPPAALPIAPPIVPIGLPSELLRRRPDVRRAERQLAAETARIGVAKSDWFPKISLTGDFGAESPRSAIGSMPAADSGRSARACNGTRSISAECGHRCARKPRCRRRRSQAIRRPYWFPWRRPKMRSWRTRRNKTGTGRSPRPSPRIGTRWSWPTVSTNTDV